MEAKAQPILIRAYSTPISDDEPVANAQEEARIKRGRKIKPIGPAPISLVFDVETTVDAAMRARVGFYRLYIGSDLSEEGIVYDPCEAFRGDTAVIAAYAASRELPQPIDLAAFRLKILRLYKAGGQIIGFNLPFDLSRIASGSTPARANKFNRAMRGGHSLILSDSDYNPRIQIKHLNPRAAIIQYSSPNGGPSRSSRGRGDDVPVNRGTFLDVRTAAGALLAGNYSLERLTRTLKTPTQKDKSSEHGQPLSFAYLDYARSDVIATWECYGVLRARYEALCLDQPFDKIKSEASVGKAILDQMGITIWRDEDAGRRARAFHTYYGGRTEVRVRRLITEIILTDFTSMYPTVCTLMKLWRFVITQGVTEHDVTEETQESVARAVASDWQSQSAWLSLTTLVRVRCAKDVFPVRAYYAGEQHASIGLNFLSSKGPLWFTLADVLAAKFLSGKAPEILEAVRFEPGPPMANLKPINLMGKIAIDPYADDPFRELVVMRERELRRGKTLSGAEREASDELRQMLKIIVNSMSYGIFVQINTQIEERGVWRQIHVHGEEPFNAKISKSEEPGPYFHPLLGTLITGAARLMLALAQHRAGEERLGWAFCDTDSIALTRPLEMARRDFLDRVRDIVAWFTPLNPYGFDDPILKVEDVNYRENSKEPRPLYCYAVASKRYALFNIATTNRLIIRKASAHGLGQYSAPYLDDDPMSTFPPQIAGLKAGKDRLARWQYDIWYAIISHELTDAPGNVRFDYHPALLRPLASRYGASSADMLRWMRFHNDRHPDYADQVKPFGALYALHAKKPDPEFTGFLALTGASRGEIHPIAPFHPNLETAVTQAFDRVTGEPVSVDQLQTYADALKRYPYKQESKFLNAEARERGVTEPRHVIVSEIHYIGKEADRWQEDFLIGLGFDPMTKFGRHPYAAAEVYTEIRMAVRVYGAKPVADTTGLARNLVTKICSGSSITTKVSHEQIRSGLRRLQYDHVRQSREERDRIERWEAAIVSEGGIRPAARLFGLNASNMQKAIQRFRREEGERDAKI